MKIELKTKIKELIDGFHENNDQVKSEIKNWKDQGAVYAKEYIDEKIKEIEADASKMDALYQHKLMLVITGAKELVLPDVVNSKPSDYAAQISNALQFLTIEGNSITDENASAILKPFVNDPDQMKLFKNVIGKRAELTDANGNGTFTKTFAEADRIEATRNTFLDMEAIAGHLLRSDSLVSYEAIAGEEDILTLSGVIEGFADKIPA
ncbi:MAG: hypothetical protein WCG21_10800 [Eubacteriales bacterium]